MLYLSILSPGVYQIAFEVRDVHGELLWFVALPKTCMTRGYPGDDWRYMEWNW
jgi:hypothetical protein